MTSLRPCGWCRALVLLDPRAVFCGRRCRQAAFRLRRRHQVDDASSTPAPRRFAYADPPYPGTARRYYGREPTYGGEVDHAALIAQLEAGGSAGWALPTSEKALRQVLPLCPVGARVCPWVKPHAIPPATRGIHRFSLSVGLAADTPGVSGSGARGGAAPADGGGSLRCSETLASSATITGPRSRRRAP